MARFTFTLHTNRPVAEVFDYVADLEHFAAWDPGVASSVRVAGSEAGPGAAYDVTLAGKRPMVLTYTIIEFDRPRRLVASAANRFVTSRDEITVVASSGGSFVEYDARLSLKGVFAVFDFALAPLFRRIGGRAANGLRDALGATRA